jgi:hypothetical protein
VSSGNDAAPDTSADSAGRSDAQDAATSDAPASDGAAGDGATASAKACFRTCNQKSDCPNIGPQELLCNADHHCVVCMHDVSCVAQSTGWGIFGDTCTSDADCKADGGPLASGDYCIDVEGVGLCAYDKSRPSANFGDPCFGTTGVFVAKKFGSSATVEVCAETSQTCDTKRGACRSDCGGDAGSICTPSQGGKVCNATTKKCECGSNTDCGGSTPTCNLASKQCECDSVNNCPTSDAAATFVCE